MSAPSQTQVSSLYAAFNTNQMSYKNYLNKLKSQLTLVKNNAQATWTDDDWMNWQNYFGDLSAMNDIDALEQQCKDLQSAILSSHPLQ